jgi:alpha-beta hydrolase superfamily lysophospholipase
MCGAGAAHGASQATHLRIQTSRGPVHVWAPARYERASAGIVIYVHGFFTDVDAAWRKHRLARQFAESGLNALFIACEAPRRPRDEVNWDSVVGLLDAVATGIDNPLPEGPVIVVGHSGAHRTITTWLGDDPIDTIVLVDALYGEVPAFRDWLDADEEHRLIDAAKLTRRWTDELHAGISETLVFDRFPPAAAGKLRGARSARVVYVRSQHDHMTLVTGGVALPMLLRAVQLPMVDNASRKAPLRAL